LLTTFIAAEITLKARDDLESGPAGYSILEPVMVIILPRSYALKDSYGGLITTRKTRRRSSLSMQCYTIHDVAKKYAASRVIHNSSFSWQFSAMNCHSPKPVLRHDLSAAKRSEGASASLSQANRQVVRTGATCVTHKTAIDADLPL